MTTITGRLTTSLSVALLLALVGAGIWIGRGHPPISPRVIAALGTAFLLVTVLGAFLARRLDRRFETLRASAEALGQGQIGVRVPVDAHDELASLARAVNALAGRLEGEIAGLRRAHESSEAVLTNLRQGIALIDRDLAIRHANARFWEAVGIDPPAKPVRLAAARQPSLEEIAAEAIGTGRRVVREVPLFVGTKEDYEVSVAPVRGAIESPKGWILSIEDLKPEREMTRLRREFVANASHELKTPLTSIRGYAETLLQGGLEDDANRRRFVETIHAQAVRLEALVEDMLQIADLERPDAVLDVKDWDLAVIVRDLCRSFEEAAVRRGLELDVEARAGIRARVDRHRLEIALQNLLDNAVKYTKRGSITVRVERTAKGVRIAVQDTGRGIEAEHLPRVFERFYRADRGRSRALGGTGLGLSIVKHVAQLHGGRVGAESRPGEGSTFWVEISPDGPHRVS